MSFANCQKGGMNMGQPDVCKTPRGDGTPAIPYPNMAQGATANPGSAVQKVLISGTPAHTLQTIVPMSQGDESGVCGGVVSGMNMGPRRHLMGAPNVLIGGMPATRLGDPTGQNGMSLNVPGSTIAPAQTKVMINSGGGVGGGGGASQQSAAKEEKKPVELKVSNPRWEHADPQVAERRKEATLVGDMVVLKADVSNVPDGTRMSFRVFDVAVSPPKQVCVLGGEVKGGVATAEWGVRRITQYEFEGKVRGVTSKRAELLVGHPFVFSH